MNILPLVRPAIYKPQILIVKDELIIEGVLEDLVHRLGYESVGTAYSVETGLRRVQNSNMQIDAAIVDIHPRHERAFELCFALSDMGIPFALGTTIPPEEILAPWRKCPIIRKPYTANCVEAVLNELLAVNRRKGVA